MKKIMIIASLVAFMASAAWTQNIYEKIVVGEVSQTGLRQAISLGEKLLLGQKSGDIYILSEEEATPEVAKGLSEGVQEASYESIRSMFGDYESMEFAEAWTMEADQVYTIYRFRGTFDDTDDKPEIRIVLDRENKLAGFWIRPWQDDLGGTP